ncbi:MAG: carbonic anhydrase [Candidatus Methylumidiphilus alinenensis]|uniref:carbonic anhydrase n=1 Tax=Candidatus Methylumidiphilus alinenensis TaxID=2202197 RepID=A0A2W4TG25_9GAMM|nr:MAG: carbonic anhydrase [Candidatus Methylumidiphilus alinenensis]
MNTKLNKLGWLGLLVAPSFLAASALAAPGWNYPDALAPGGVSSWGQIVDSTSTAPVPLNYPYSECGVGQHQSPINVNSADLVQRSGSDIINFYYNTADALQVVNNGHNIVVEGPTTTPDKLYFGTLQSYDEYTLVQYHLHVPSEHTYNGASYPMEIHFVHATTDGREVVVGVLVQEGATNPELQKILDNAPPTGTNVITTIPGVSINPNGLLPANTKSYVTYAGSLTTPPCSEGVNWYVLTNLIQASSAQIAQFQAILQNTPTIKLQANARNTNLLNGRLVNLKP